MSKSIPALEGLMYIVVCIPSKQRRRTKKWNELGFYRPPFCTYRLNWARITSRGWWDDWDDTVLQTQDLKLEPWQSEAEHATSRSRRLPTILTFTRGWGRNFFCFFQTAETGNRTPNSGVKGSGANHYPRAPSPCPSKLGCFNVGSSATTLTQHQTSITTILYWCWLCESESRPTSVSTK